MPRAGSSPKQAPEMGLSEQRARTVFACALDAIVLFDDARRFLDANPAACELFGVARGALLGRSVDAFAGPHGADLVEPLWSELMRVGRLAGGFTIHRPDGARRHVEFRARARIEPGVHLSILRDGTDLARLEQRRWLEQELARVLSGADDGDTVPSALQALCLGIGWHAASVWLLAPGGRRLRWASGWAAEGLRVDDLFTANAETLLRPGEGLVGGVWATCAAKWMEDLAADEGFTRREVAASAGLRSGFALPLRAGASLVGVLEFLSTTPRPRDPWLYETMTSAAQPLGELLERRRTEAELRRSRRHLDVVLRSVADGVMALDAARSVVYANDAAARVYGYATGPALMATGLEEIHSEIALFDGSGRELELSEYPTRRALAGLALSDEVVRIRLRGQPGERTLVVSATPVFDDDGAMVLVIVVLRDVTDGLEAERARRAEHEARALARRLSEAVDSERRKLAHDLHDAVGQTLSMIKLSLERASSEPPGLSLAEPLGLLDETIRQIRTMTFELHPAMLDDLGLVPTLRRYAEQVSAGAGLRVTVSESGRRRSLPSSAPNYVFRAVKEMISNAAKHARASEIWVTVRWEPEALRVVVDDDGVGMTPGDRGPPGAMPGLGLASIRERAAALGGRFEIESEPGAGTRVFLEVPLSTGGPGEADEPGDG